MSTSATASTEADSAQRKPWSSEMNEKSLAGSIKPVCDSVTKDVVVPGCIVLEDFITAEEEEVLLKSPVGAEDSSKWIDTSIGRRQQHYGFKFNYYTRMIDFLNPVDPMPDVCAAIVDRIEQYVHTHLDPHNSTGGKGAAGADAGNAAKYASLPMLAPMNQLTVNEYHAGQGIGNHIDTVNCIGPVLVSLSLGSDCTMLLAPAAPADSGAGAGAAAEEQCEDTSASSGSACTRSKKYVFLPRRSVIILHSEARYEYTHGIAYRKCDVHDGVLSHRARRVSLTFRQVTLPGAIPSSKLVSTELEKAHVFEVYDNIAEHWHHTRGKRKVFWARVKEFIEALPAGSLVADVGCGDGKYFGVTNANHIVMIGCDRSMGLLEALNKSDTAAASSSSSSSSSAASAEAGAEGGHGEGGTAAATPNYNQTFCCDAVQVPMLSNAFDAALCIAVLHHINTVDRRVAVIRELVRIVRPGGFVLIQAWAYEQEENSRHKFSQSKAADIGGRCSDSSSSAAASASNPPAPPSGSAASASPTELKPPAAARTGEQPAINQDVLVPWRLSKCYAQQKPAAPEQEQDQQTQQQQQQQRQQRMAAAADSSRGQQAEPNDAVDANDQSDDDEATGAAVEAEGEGSEVPNSLRRDYAALNLSKEQRKQRKKELRKAHKREQKQQAMRAAGRRAGDGGEEGSSMSITALPFGHTGAVFPSKSDGGGGVGEESEGGASSSGGAITEDDLHVVYQRYCHVYKAGELEDLCSSVPGVRVVDSGYDKNNWYVVLEKYDIRGDARLTCKGSAKGGAGAGAGASGGSVDSAGSTPMVTTLPAGMPSAVPVTPFRVRTTVGNK